MSKPEFKKFDQLADLMNFTMVTTTIVNFVDDVCTKAHLDLVDTAIVDLKKAPALVMVS